VLASVIPKLQMAFAGAARVMREALRPRPCSIVGGLLTDLLRSRAELTVENILLRQQLIVAARKVKRPVLRRRERTLITLLAAALPRWRDALLLVKPETVLRWHSEGFRLLWRWKSRAMKAPTLRLSSDVIELIQRMATENRLWGAERVRGELIKLGIHVAKRTVQRHMRDRRNPAPPRGQNWHTFLRNHPRSSDGRSSSAHEFRLRAVFSAAAGACVSTTLLFSAKGTSVRCSRSIAFAISTPRARIENSNSACRLHECSGGGPILPA
jgi:hypothetical protein